MDIFIRNVAYAAREVDVQICLAEILHKPPFPLNPPINFYCQLYHAKSGGKHKAIGMLTFPTEPLGETFLRLYGSLLSSNWEDLLVVYERREWKARASEPIILQEFLYGRFCRDGSFSAENSLSGNGQII